MLLKLIIVLILEALFITYCLFFKDYKKINPFRKVPENYKFEWYEFIAIIIYISWACLLFNIFIFGLTHYFK